MTEERFREVFNRLERLIDYHVSGRKGAGNHLYRLLTTELWLRTCVAGTASPVTGSIS